MIEVSPRAESGSRMCRMDAVTDTCVSIGRFKGVGPKTVACVMMFCLARDEFPVDTHVWRISKSLGWVPAKASREDTYKHMNIRVPADIR